MESNPANVMLEVSMILTNTNADPVSVARLLEIVSQGLGASAASAAAAARIIELEESLTCLDTDRAQDAIHQRQHEKKHAEDVRWLKESNRQLEESLQGAAETMRHNAEQKECQERTIQELTDQLEEYRQFRSSSVDDDDDDDAPDPDLGKCQEYLTVLRNTALQHQEIGKLRTELESTRQEVNSLRSDNLKLKERIHTLIKEQEVKIKNLQYDNHKLGDRLSAEIKKNKPVCQLEAKCRQYEDTIDRLTWTNCVHRETIPDEDEEEKEEED